MVTQNRRSFLSSLILGCSAPFILPASLTYKRVWKKENEIYKADMTGYAYMVFYTGPNDEICWRKMKLTLNTEPTDYNDWILKNDKNLEIKRTLI